MVPRAEAKPARAGLNMAGLRPAQRREEAGVGCRCGTSDHFGFGTRQFLSSPMKQPEVRLLGVGAASALRARGAAGPGATAAAEHVTGQPIPGCQADGDLWLRD